MKSLWLILTVAITAIHGLCDEAPGSQPDTNRVAFRAPFTLRLHVDKGHYYEQEFPKTPYVFKNDVYLFKDDVFGIDLKITNGAVRGVSYQSDTNKAAVTLRFTQEIEDDDEPTMLLVINNRTKHKLVIDALMTVPHGERPQTTSILPMEAGLIGFESWPHPIVQLVLRNFRFADEPRREHTTSTNASSQPGKGRAVAGLIESNGMYHIDIKMESPEEVLPAGTFPYAVDMKQVLLIYGELTGAQLEVAESVRVFPGLFRFPKEYPPMTRRQACELVEKILREQAGVEVIQSDSKHTILRFREKTP